MHRVRAAIYLNENLALRHARVGTWVGTRGRELGNARAGTFREGPHDGLPGGRVTHNETSRPRASAPGVEWGRPPSHFLAPIRQAGEFRGTGLGRGDLSADGASGLQELAFKKCL